MKIVPSIFKAYDIRGIYPGQLNNKVAYAIGVAYARFLFNSSTNRSGSETRNVIVGRDVRTTGQELMDALIVGLQSENVEVTEIADCITTELIYFASGNYDFDGAIAVTASHNPREYNGFKMCRKNAEVISGDTGIQDIKDLALQVDVPEIFPVKKDCPPKDIFSDYFEFLKDKFILTDIKEFSIVANPNFGMQGAILKKLIDKYNLPLKVTYLNEEPNGEFPKGRPDPMIPSNRQETSDLVTSVKADFGVAWDADADRCFFYDGQGEYVDPYYINALFTDFILSNDKSKKILHDCRLEWLVQSVGEKYQNKIILDKAGSAFMKTTMRNQGVYFGAEVTGHYFFQDFFIADNGLIPLLWMLQILTSRKQSLHELVAEYKKHFFKVDEMLFVVDSVKDIIEKVKTQYQSGTPEALDGISYSFDDWRFNARGSNTEPLLKVNIEAKSQGVLDEKVKELEDFLISQGAKRKTE